MHHPRHATPLWLALLALGATFGLVVPPVAAQDDGSGGAEFVPEDTTPPEPLPDESPSEQPGSEQTPQTQWVPQGPGPAEEGPAEETSPPTYDPEGRRDPFRPLIGQQSMVPGSEEECADPNDIRCLLHTDVKLTAILQTPTGAIAMFEGGPQKRGYAAREGDRFKTAYIYSIDYPNLRVTIREELDDPRLLKPYRDYAISLFREEEMALLGRPAPR